MIKGYKLLKIKKKMEIDHTIESSGTDPSGDFMAQETLEECSVSNLNLSLESEKPVKEAKVANFTRASAIDNNKETKRPDMNELKTRNVFKLYQMEHTDNAHLYIAEYLWK
jgi:protein-tyrosine-phosphatase